MSSAGPTPPQISLDPEVAPPSEPGTSALAVTEAPRHCPVCRVPATSTDAFCSRCGAALGATPGAEKDPLLGAVIDNRYRVIERLGQGGMGSVYLAEHVGIGKRVAVKVLRPHLRTQPELVRRFRREALLVSKLTDAHTITVFDFGTWEGLIYFVMEYLRGEDLGKLLEREPRLPPARALAIAHQICSSLAEAHAAGLVHRDLKPENVFLLRTAGGDEWVKVLDFGLAKTVREMPELIDARGEPAFQTAHGALLGTPYFMAPEQVRGDPVDGRTDLYALGALIYRMISGDFPHTGRTPLQVLESHLSGIVKPLTESAPGARLPEGCDALVRKMLARAPDDRPADASEVSQQLLRISQRAQQARPEGESEWASATWEGGRPEPLPMPDGPTRDEVVEFERSLRWRAWSRVLLLLVVLGAAGAAGYWAFHHGPPVALREEVEPNEDPATANPLTPGLELKGHIGRRLRRDTSDRDVFVVAGLPPGAHLEGQLGPVPGLDLVLEGYDREGKLLFKINENGKDAGEHLPPTAPTADPLYLVVREVWVQGEMPLENSTDAYTLRVDRAPR
jgi:serine/threonine protein kinase